jgi:predicted dehydrogenase
MTLRWGIAGTGAMARVFAGDLPHARDADLVAVSSRSRDSAEAFAADTAGTAGTGHGSVVRGLTHRELLADPDVDVVYVATPHPQHLALALAAIEAGKPVLVEKSFTATLAGTEQVVAAARERGVFCMEAMWTRFLPPLVRVRELVAAGEVGEPLLVQADLGAFRAFDPTSRLFDPRLGGGAVLDLGVYVVSLAQHLLGDPDAVTATGTTYPSGADRSVALHLAYDDGRAASLQATLAGESPGRAVVTGTGGSIELAPRFHHPEQIVVRRNGGAAETELFSGPGRGYFHEIDEVARCLEAGLTESEVMPLRDTLAVQGVLQQALDQLGVEISEDTDFRV